MPRHSKIDTLGLGDKVISYHLAGRTLEQIAKQIGIEHPGADLTSDNVHKYIQKHEGVLREKKSQSINTNIHLTLEAVQQTLLETVGEIRKYLEEYKDDPKHAANFLRLKLDAIEKMTKMLGGYPSDRPAPVNVQVNVLNAGKEFESAVRASEDYFASLETNTLTEGQDTRNRPDQSVHTP